MKKKKGQKVKKVTWWEHCTWYVTREKISENFKSAKILNVFLVVLKLKIQTIQHCYSEFLGNEGSGQPSTH